MPRAMQIERRNLLKAAAIAPLLPPPRIAVAAWLLYLQWNDQLQQHLNGGINLDPLYDFPSRTVVGNPVKAYRLHRFPADKACLISAMFRPKGLTAAKQEIHIPVGESLIYAAVYYEDGGCKVMKDELEKQKCLLVSRTKANP